MAALIANTDRRAKGVGHAFLLGLAGVLPFVDSFLGADPATGYARPLVAGDAFVGLCKRQVIARDASTANGGLPNIEAMIGLFRFQAVIAGVTQADVAANRRVYAINDNDLTLAAESGGSPIGYLCGTDVGFGGIANGVMIQAITKEMQQFGDGIAGGGIAALPDANATVTLSQLGQLLTFAPTAARTYTLPAVAKSAGKTVWFQKQSSDQLVHTIQANAAETINGGNTLLFSSPQWAWVALRCDGTQWLVIGSSTPFATITLADGAPTLTKGFLNQLLLMANTIARTITLPPAASVAGMRFLVKKTSAAAAAITVKGNAAETIDGANTQATTTAQYSYLEGYSDGTQWWLTSKI